MAVAELSFDLKQLPIRAMLAHASRCARRVQHLFRLDSDHPDTPAFRRAVESAIRLAEGFAAGNEIDPQLVSQIEEITIHALLAASTDSADDKRSAYAANAAYAVVSATAAALLAEQADDPSDSVVRVVEACMIATESAISADEVVEAGARLDWEMLHRMRLGKFPDMGEPINPAETGMLGPLNCRKARPAHQRSEEQISPVAATSTAANKPRKPDCDPRAEKFKRSLAKLRLRQSKLRSQRATLESERSAFLAQQQALDARTTEARTEQANLERQRDELRRTCEELQQKIAQLEQSQAENAAACKKSSSQDLANLQSRSNELAVLQKELGAREGEIAKAAQQIDEREAELSALHNELLQDRKSLEHERAAREHEENELRDRRAQLDQRQNSLDERQKCVAAATAKISTIRKRFDKRRRRLADERAALEAEQSRLQAVASQAEATVAQLSADREQLESLRAELRQSQADHQAALDAFNREKAQLDAKEIELANSLEELNARRLAANAAEQEQQAAARQEHSGGQQGLGSLLHQLRDERQKLEVERREIAELRAGLNAARRLSQMPSKPASNDPTAAEMLTFLLDPGDSSGRQLSAIFSTLSQLYQSLGGPGLVFEVRACRLWSYDARPDSRSKQSSQRVFAQVRGRADESAARSDKQCDRAVWDRFVSSVMTGIGMDSTLADHFDLGEDVTPDHAATAAIYDAVDFALHASQADDAGQHPGLSIDAINQQMRRLETVRKKLEEQHHLRIELSAVGPCVEDDAPQKSAAPTKALPPKPALAAAATPKLEPPKHGLTTMKLLGIAGLILVLIAIVLVYTL